MRAVEPYRNRPFDETAAVRLSITASASSSTFTAPCAELLFDVLSQAYERTSVVVTMNLPFERWVEVLGCQRLTGPTLDRLTHHCHVLEANGQRYRLKDATRRRKGG